MAIYESFENIFSQFPELDKKDDFNSFWDKSIKESKKVPLEAEFIEKKGKQNSKFTIIKVIFKSFMRTPIYGTIYKPKNKKKTNPVILIHDYYQPHYYQTFPLIDNFTYFFLTVRGHHSLEQIKDEEQAQTKPEFVIENILDIDSYYMKGVYLDTLRTIDLLRLDKDIDCSNIALIGKGLGAAAALFCSAYSDRITSLCLDTPSFSYLPVAQNIADSEFTKEINSFIEKNKKAKNKVKDNLKYFDSLNFTDKIKSKIYMNIGLKDKISPPVCSMALFNRMLADKFVEIYPNGGNESGGVEQFKKSLLWLKKNISTVK